MGSSVAPHGRLFPTNFSAFSRLGQVILAVVMVLGNGVLITIAPVVTRLFHFHRFFKQKNITQKTGISTHTTPHTHTTHHDTHGATRHGTTRNTSANVVFQMSTMRCGSW
jgi:hypothetical protein